MKGSDMLAVCIGAAGVGFALAIGLAANTGTLKEVDKVMQECEDSLTETNAPRNTTCDLVLSYKTTNNGGN